ncbi:hypothetical protein Nmel_014043 [Mimus melanotis]
MQRTSCGTSPAASSSQAPALDREPQGHGGSLNPITAGPDPLVLPQALEHRHSSSRGMAQKGRGLFSPRAIFNPTQKSSAFYPLPTPCLDTRTACF